MCNNKGPGSFRSLFAYALGGKKDGLQILPVSEIAAKDEFSKIQNCTQDDVLAAYRVPPQLLGTIPNNTGGFGDVAKAATVFGYNAIKPLQGAVPFPERVGRPRRSLVQSLSTSYQ